MSKIGGYNFKWIASGDSDIGVMAQEIEAVLPHVVHTSTSNGTKRVDYMRIIPLLIEAIKKLNDRVNTLLTDVEQLKNANN